MVELPGLIIETVTVGTGLPLSRLRVSLLKDFLLSGSYDINSAFQTSTVCFVFGLRSGVSRLSDYCLGLSDSFPGCLNQAVAFESRLSTFKCRPCL